MNTASIVTMNTINNYIANINKIDTDIAIISCILDNDDNLSLKDETALENDKYDSCYDKYRLMTELLYYGLTYRNVWSTDNVNRTLYNLSIHWKDQLKNTTIPIRTMDDARTYDELMKVFKQIQLELSEETKMRHNYHLRPQPKLTKYHGMDTIEPYNEFTDIYYDNSQHYDEDYVYETDYDDDELDDEDEDDESINESINESIIESDTDEDESIEEDKDEDDDDDADEDNDSDYDELEFEEDCKWVKVLDDFYDCSYWNYVEEEEKYDIGYDKVHMCYYLK